jgi:hypothetical protein
VKENVVKYLLSLILFLFLGCTSQCFADASVGVDAYISKATRKVICQSCQRQGEKSKSYPLGTTIIMSEDSALEHYDEQGFYHPEKRDRKKVDNYTCSNGHFWQENLP